MADVKYASCSDFGTSLRDSLAARGEKSLLHINSHKLGL